MKPFTDFAGEHYNKCICFSPHLDDAAFSAGSLLSQISRIMPITVVNVFTSAGDAKNTLSARVFLKQCGMADPSQLYATRLKEDRDALSLLNARVINLGYTEALWRKKKHANKLTRIVGDMAPECVSLYPTYRFHVLSGVVHREDRELINRLTGQIKGIAGKSIHKTLLLAPAGFGNHVDHIIVRNACRDAFGEQMYYWMDFPYFSVSNKPNDFIEKNMLVAHEVETDENAKKHICSHYASQYNIVFKDKSVLSSSEKFFAPYK